MSFPFGGYPLDILLEARQNLAPIRICSVGFLNARPLTWGLSRRSDTHRYQLLETTPAVCADRLARGEADVGLIPSIEYQKIPNLRVFPEICIASRKQARSVLLLSKVASTEIRSVALDSSSRTSATLLKILLTRRARHPVAYRTMAPNLYQMLDQCDAALLIGDRALKVETGDYRVYDLASEWYEMTGLPFVFAFWAVRPQVELPEGIRPFLESREEGLRSIPEITAEEARRTGLSGFSLSDYLRNNIHYSMGKEEIRGLWLFYRLALETGVLPSLKQGAFFQGATSATESLISAGGMP